MLKVTSLLAVMMLAESALAGEISIGFDSWLGGTRSGTCHATTISGPLDAVRSYEKRQKERFENADPAVVERLNKSVLMSVTVVTHKQPECAQNSGTPEKIVITPPKSREPILVIPLVPEAVELSNLAGAKFTATNASASVPVEDIERLAGKEYEFHLIYSDHAYKDRWKADYSAKILRAK